MGADRTAPARRNYPPLRPHGQTADPAVRTATSSSGLAPLRPRAATTRRRREHPLGTSTCVILAELLDTLVVRQLRSRGLSSYASQADPWPSPAAPPAVTSPQSQSEANSSPTASTRSKPAWRHCSNSPARCPPPSSQTYSASPHSPPPAGPRSPRRTGPATPRTAEHLRDRTPDE